MSVVNLTCRDRAAFEVVLPASTVDEAVALLRAHKKALRRWRWAVRPKPDGQVRLAPVNGSTHWVPPFVTGRLVPGPDGVVLRGHVVESAFTVVVNWGAVVLVVFFGGIAALALPSEPRVGLIMLGLAAFFGWGLYKLVTVPSVLDVYVAEAERALRAVLDEQAVEG